MHFCSDELMMLLSVIPFVSYLTLRVRNWWCSKHKKHKCECENKQRLSDENSEV